MHSQCVKIAPLVDGILPFIGKMPKNLQSINNLIQAQRIRV